MAARYYEGSGAITPTGVAAGLGVGAGVGAVCGVVYAYLLRYNPFLYFNVLAPIVLALVLAFSVSSGVRMGKLRNAAVTGVVGMLAAAISLYVSWVFWVSCYIPDGTLFWDPQLLWMVMGKINEVGPWSIGKIGRDGATVSGIFLWCIWAAEAACVILGTGFIAWSTQADLVFCEACDQWADDESLHHLAPLDLVASNELAQALRDGQYDALGSVGFLHGEDAWTRVKLVRCEGCTKSQYLTLSRVTCAPDSDGDMQETEEKLVENLWVSPDLLEFAATWDALAAEEAASRREAAVAAEGGEALGAEEAAEG